MTQLFPVSCTAETLLQCQTGFGILDGAATSQDADILNVSQSFDLKTWDKNAERPRGPKERGERGRDIKHTENFGHNAKVLSNRKKRRETNLSRRMNLKFCYKFCHALFAKLCLHYVQHAVLHPYPKRPAVVAQCYSVIKHSFQSLFFSLL